MIAAVIFSIWLLWLLAIVHSMWSVRSTPGGAAYTGFRLILEREKLGTLSPGEIEAVRCHELGHKYYHHPWKVLARWAFFQRPSELLLRWHEVQADNYAAARGHALTLSAALRKRGGCRFDMQRADRLERIGVEQLSFIARDIDSLPLQVHRA